jgi:hypothetical protein
MNLYTQAKPTSEQPNGKYKEQTQKILGAYYQQQQYASNISC